VPKITDEKNSVIRSCIDNKGLIIVTLSFFVVMVILLYNYKVIWWDSSVYIGMGKYIFSYSKSGLWEESRPIILPFILGLGWYFGLDGVIFGRIVSVIFSVLILIMTYIIGSKIISKRFGLIAALLTASSFTFVFFSANILSEVPATLFMLLAFYFFLKEKHFLMGLFSGLAILTRFFQLFALLGIYIIYFVYIYKKPNFNRKLFSNSVGLLLIILPYALLSLHLYDDVLLPFKVQSQLTRTTGWMLYEDNLFYFRALLNENLLFVLLFVLLVLYKNDHRFNALVFAPFVYIIIFSFIKHKETRFMFVILPMLYLLLAYCIDRFYAKVKNKVLAKRFFHVIIFFLMLFTFIKINNAIQNQQQDQQTSVFQNYLNKNNNGKVWITSPLYALYSDGKIDGLLYYYSSKNLMKFLEANRDADTVLYNSCDMECPPVELDALCPKSRSILNKMLLNFETIYQKDVGLCKYRIYKKAI